MDRFLVPMLVDAYLNELKIQAVPDEDKAGEDD